MTEREICSAFFFDGRIRMRKTGHTFTKSDREEACMSKPTKSKKDKVPKITEAEYTEYISHLREESERLLALQENNAIKNNNIEEE